MKVLITGSSGLIGAALTDSLEQEGHEVVRLWCRNFVKDSPDWNPENEIINLEKIRDINAVVHLAGENIADGRWSEKKKDRILSSRVKGTKLLAKYFAKADKKPEVFISASAVGYYGDRGEVIVDEASSAGRGFLADVCVQWEEASNAANEAGIRVANVRFGTVLSTAGGALKKMLLPFKLGAGGVIGSGEQYMSWISINDAVNIIQHILNNDSLRGPINAVTPNAVTNRLFTKTLGKALHRPTIFPLPASVARILFGEMADELLLSSIRIFPGKLVESGYKFQDNDLSESLDKLLLTQV
ncbi:MAG: Epimerase family protein [Deltaproteobacteria bacterium]|jgi:uncharacterized protein (TIGR01777 family)|nr:Epimerase family protein [Deltaproteobacteria bacterium]